MMNDFICFTSLLSQGKVGVMGVGCYNPFYDSVVDDIFIDGVEHKDHYVQEFHNNPYLFVTVVCGEEKTYMFPLDKRGNIDEDGVMYVGCGWDVKTENGTLFSSSGRPSYRNMLYLNALLDSLFGDI